MLPTRQPANLRASRCRLKLMYRVWYHVFVNELLFIISYCENFFYLYRLACIQICMTSSRPNWNILQFSQYSSTSVLQRSFHSYLVICICTSMCIYICTFLYIYICIFRNVWAAAVGAYWSLCRVLRSVIQRSRNYCHKWHRPDRCFSSHNLSTMLSSQTRFTDPSVKDVHFASDNWKKLHLFSLEWIKCKQQFNIRQN